MLRRSRRGGSGGYELPSGSIREQIASAVDLIVHTAVQGRSRKVVQHHRRSTGSRDDEILTQTSLPSSDRHARREGRGDPQIDRGPAGRLGSSRKPGSRCRRASSASRPGPDARPGPAREGTGRHGRGTAGARRVPAHSATAAPSPQAVIVFLSSMDPSTLDRRVSVTRSRRRRPSARAREGEARGGGSSLEKVVWATGPCATPPSSTPHEEVGALVPGDTPVGQGTLDAALQRRAGFRVSIGVIAAA